MAHEPDQLSPRRAGVILAIETSCDDTCAAVVSHAGEIHSNVISSQGVHSAYGGVVPEIASRHHLELIGPVIDDALARAETDIDSIDLVAVTRGPGLVGALLVGLSSAKALAAARELPLAAVDHPQVDAPVARAERPADVARLDAHSAAVGREVERVVDEVGDGALQQGRVGGHHRQRHR